MTSIPGWHADPSGRHQHRYWDGQRWTEHVADGGASSIDPVAGGPPSPDVGQGAIAPSAGPSAGVIVGAVIGVLAVLGLGVGVVVVAAGGGSDDRPVAASDRTLGASPLGADDRTVGSGDDDGDDPALDALHDRCADADFAACDELYRTSPFGSAYEAFGATCGDRNQPAGYCVDVHGVDGPSELAELRAGCEAEVWDDCDTLYWQSPVDSDDEDFGATCGRRREWATTPCSESLG